MHILREEGLETEALGDLEHMWIWAINDWIRELQFGTGKELWDNICVVYRGRCIFRLATVLETADIKGRCH